MLVSREQKDLYNRLKAQCKITGCIANWEFVEKKKGDEEILQSLEDLRVVKIKKGRNKRTNRPEIYIRLETLNINERITR